MISRSPPLRLDDVPIVSETPETPEALVQGLQAAGSQTVVLTDLEDLTENDWQHVDLLRSRLAREGSTILAFAASGGRASEAAATTI
ncbi:MAG: hypothetical protein H0T76_01370 [Nannocystis sp.]|nr:hypothetical protein [Nannocystis sp.]MBA3545111.1 hypothetical protein [Nannocystis sp.]